MATVNFRLKGVAETASIKVRFKQGDQFDFELATGLKTFRNHWSTKQQRVKNMIDAPYKDKVNESLNNLSTFLLNEYYLACANNTAITQRWLKAKVSECLYGSDIDKNNESEIYFTPFIEKIINESYSDLKVGNDRALSDSTIKSYETALNKLEKFEKKYGVKHRILDINLNFHSEFNAFLSEEELLSPNTIGWYFDKIKMFCSLAEVEGLKVSHELKSKKFFSPKNSTNDIYLNVDEIELIFNHKFTSEKLSNSANWLLAGVWSGLRVSDLLQLTHKNVVNNLISLTTIKTKTEVHIPIHPHVKKILLKYNNNFPRKISEQKFNMYIKEVCKEVGINQLVEGAKIVPIKVNDKLIYRKKQGIYPKYELVSSHICRRSFATNFYNKIDNLTIMKVTGHKSIKTFMAYIKTTSTEYAENLSKTSLFSSKD
jgi:integrase